MITTERKLHKQRAQLAPKTTTKPKAPQCKRHKKAWLYKEQTADNLRKDALIFRLRRCMEWQ